MVNQASASESEKSFVAAKGKNDPLKEIVFVFKAGFIELAGTEQLMDVDSGISNK